ncbi:MAG: DMT family transporter [Pseudomonadota bacterium]
MVQPAAEEKSPAPAQQPPSRTGWLEGSNVDRPALAAGLMVFALMLLGLQDALVKLTSDAVSLWQFQLIRSGINLIIVLLIARLIWGSARLRPRSWAAVLLRSICLVTTMVLFFGGVPFLGLAEIAAGLYTYPLYIAVLSALFLGERVGPRRIAAIVAGFVGTLLILKPGTDSFSAVTLMPIAAAVFYALTVMVTRKLCREESPVTLAYGVALTFLTVGVLGTSVFSAPATVTALGDLRNAWPYLLTGWREVSLLVVAIIATCSLLNVIANVCLAKSYQSAESSWLALFDYSYLIFATFWGFVFSGAIPDALTFAGMALIAAGGIFVAWRERVEQRDLAQRANFHRSLR